MKYLLTLLMLLALELSFGQSQMVESITQTEDSSPFNVIFIAKVLLVLIIAVVAIASFTQWAKRKN